MVVPLPTETDTTLLPGVTTFSTGAVWGCVLSGEKGGVSVSVVSYKNSCEMNKMLHFVFLTSISE